MSYIRHCLNKIKQNKRLEIQVIIEWEQTLYRDVFVQPVISARGKQCQEHLKFKVSLGYIIKLYL